MKTFSRRTALFGGAALCAVAVSGRAALANGDVFFEAEEIPGQTEFVYFGSVKDDDGNYLEGAIVTTVVKEPQLTYDAYTNVLGRYRTLDVGRAVVDLGFEIDPKIFDVTVTLPGYTQVRRFNRGRAGQNKGAVELNFVMKKNPEGVAKK
jgi:hypothetical protein